MPGTSGILLVLTFDIVNDALAAICHTDGQSVQICDQFAPLLSVIKVTWALDM